MARRASELIRRMCYSSRMRLGVGLLVLGSAAFGITALAAACSSFGSGDPSPAGAEAGGDAASPGAILLESFEGDQGGCGAVWRGLETTSVDRIADAGTDGSFGCRVCSNVGLQGYFSLAKSLGNASGPPQAGYLLELDMRVESGKADIGAAFSVGGQFVYGTPVSAPGWHHVTAIVSPEAGTSLTAEASARMGDAPPSCVVVDNIMIRKVD